MRLIWILSREGPCVRLSVVGACVPRAACAFLAGGPLDDPKDKAEQRCTFGSTQPQHQRSSLAFLLVE